MTYLINDIWYTLQGEGYWTGRAAVFCRFARCNLWTGREEDRARAVCKFCDTDFTHGERLTLDDLLGRLAVSWPIGMPGNAMVVFTGGEPSLQLDQELVDAVHEMGFFIAVETNGTRLLPQDIDWVCVSPKAGTDIAQDEGDELKVVWPQPIDLDSLYADTDFVHHWLSPMDGPNLAENTAAAIEYVLAHPQWRLNTQTHKAIGVK